MEKRCALYLGNFSSKHFAATNRSLGILNMLSNLGFDLHMGFYGEDISSYEKSFPIMKNITVHHFSFKKITFYYSHKDIAEIINKIPNLSLVFLYNYPAIPSFSILRLCKKRGIKVISDVTEWYDTSNVSIWLKPFKKIDTSLRMRHFNKKADGLIVISNYLQQYYKGVNTIKIYPLFDNNCIAAKWNNKNNQYTFGYAGIAGKRKDDLIGFLKELIDIKFFNCNFLLIGDVSKKTLMFFDKNNFKYEYLGRMAHEDAIEQLLKCRCQIIYRNQTRMNNAGFPTKFAEAIYLNMPIICNDFSDLSLFKDGNILKIDRDKKLLQSFLKSTDKQAFYNSHTLEPFQTSFYIKDFSVFIETILNK